MAVIASSCASSAATGLHSLRRCASEGDIGRQGHASTPIGRQGRAFTDLQGQCRNADEARQAAVSEDEIVHNRDGLAFLGEAEEPAAMSECGNFFSAPSEAVALRVLGSSLIFKSVLSDPGVPNCGQGTGKVGALKKQIERRVATLETQEQTIPLAECNSMIDRITTKMQTKLDVLQEKVKDSLKLQHAAEEELLNCRRVFNNESSELLMQVEVLTAVKLQLSAQTKELAARCKELEENFESCCGKDICVICMEAPSNAVFTNCGHMVCCERCAASLPQCPMCRETVQNWIKIYRS